MPGRNRGGVGRPGWVRRMKWLYGGCGRPSRKLTSHSPVGGWNELASFVLLVKLTLDSSATEPVRLVASDLATWFVR